MDLFNSVVSVFVKYTVIFLALVQGFLATHTMYTMAPVAAHIPFAVSTSTTENFSSTTTVALYAAKNSFPYVPSTSTTTPSARTTHTSVPVVQKTSVAVAPKVETPPPPSIDPNTLNTNTRAAVVNIFCTVQAGNLEHYISGSGAVVDTRGVILTNAHVAQFLLLDNYPNQSDTNCLIRTGAPAQPKYRASVLYLPPTWVAENASQILSDHAVGTGEGDYAFLYITGSATPGEQLPSSFPALSMTIDLPHTGDSVLLAGYPAGFLGSTAIERNLYASSAFTTVQTLYTFDSTSTIDIVSVKGTIVSQGGSSGGAAVRADDGDMQGLIVNETDATTTANRDLRALTLSYINRSLVSAGAGGIEGALSGDLSTRVAQFASTIGATEKTLLQKTIDAR